MFGVPAPPLACSVRGCGRPLVRRERCYVCPSGHSFDVARVGYVNLLQPDDRRSLAAGDSAKAVDARERLLAAGAGRALVDTLLATVSGLQLPPGAVVVDLGAGTGHHLAAIAGAFGLAGIGIDLSTAAASHAARRHPGLTWVVANADRRLPLLDASVDLVLSIHARRHPLECARVLTSTGTLIVCVPAPDDLAELRAAVQGRAIARDRTADVVAEHAAHFALRDRTAARQLLPCDRAALRDLLAGTYRGERTGQAGAVASLDALDVTLSSDVLVFARR